MTDGSFTQTPKLRRLGIVAAIALLPIFTGVFYLNGWAYHEGYLEYFHLPPSMFPLDLQATLIQGVFAWLNGGSEVLTWMLRIVGDHWVIGLAAIFLISAFRLLARPVAAFLAKKRPPAFTDKWHLPVWMQNWIWGLMRMAAETYIVFYIPFAALSAMILVLVVLVAPFQGVGAEIAKKDAQRNFMDSPEAFLTGPDSVRRSFRLMSCEGPFCALYAAGHSVVVPRDTVTWASAPMAGTIQTLAK